MGRKSKHNELQKASPPDFAVHPINLLFTFPELLAMIEDATVRRDWRNVTLAASGALQLLDDEIAKTNSVFVRLGVRLTRATPRLRPIVRRMLNFQNRRSYQHYVDLRCELLRIASEAARADITRGLYAPGIDGFQVTVLRSYAARIASSSVTRIPSCFRAFDQHPDDVVELVRRFVKVHGGMQRLLIVGVRTSGSYLAPYVAAALAEHASCEANIVSARSEIPFSIDDVIRITSAAAQNEHVLVVDDPPASGYALQSTCDQLAEHGIRPNQITLLLNTFDDELPRALQHRQAICLPYSQWSIHRRMMPDALQTLLRAFLRSDDVYITNVMTEVDEPRRHTAVAGTAMINGEERTFCAYGVGIGYFGEHEEAVYAALGDAVEESLGVSDGVHIVSQAVSPGTSRVTPTHVAAYLAARQRKLAVKQDRSLALVGCQPVWEVASEQLARVFARLWPVARIAFVDRAVRWFLRSAAYAVPDGNMAPDLFVGTESGIKKRRAALRAFDARDLVTFDLAYDVASYAMLCQDPITAKQIRACFQTDVADVTPEKWMLYSLVQAWDQHRLRRWSQVEYEREQSRITREYFAQTIFDDVTSNDTGPLVILDVDGVIDNRVMGFNAPSTSSMLAIRSLHKHGYRLVVATGRCTEEVQHMVKSYKLTAGIAEYGSTFVSADQAITSSLSLSERREIAAMRQACLAMSHVELDAAYRSSIRVSRRDAKGRRSAPEGLVLPSTLRAIHGQSQSDIIAASISKEHAVQRLADFIDVSRIALVVGDTDSDIAMMQLGESSAVPAHASARVRKAASVVAKEPYQAGLAEIVEQIIGHPTGGCKQCKLTTSSHDTRVMLDILRITDGSRRRMLLRTMRALRTVYWHARRS